MLFPGTALRIYGIFPRVTCRSPTTAIQREHIPLLMDQPISRGLHLENRRIGA
jgi:hypothetical protein